MKNTNIDRVLKEVIRGIRPDKRAVKDADDIVKRINSKLKKAGINAECVKGGSIAKDTYLKDDYDIDLFIRYNPSYKDGNISDISERILQEVCTELDTGLERIHGSRDYFQFNLKKSRKKITYEIIPVIFVNSKNYQEAQNITDLSPEHVYWVKKHTDRNPQLADEIRLAKQFCKANKVYGAESYINGFSGHILDILVIHFGSFHNLMNAFSRYDEKSLQKHIIIDTEKHLKNPLKELNGSKISPLILVDPIQKDRNSAAALGEEKLLMFINAAKGFLKKPDKRSFEIKKFDMEKEISHWAKGLKLQRGTFIVVKIEMTVAEGSKDVVGTKALKAYETILSHAGMYGFKILRSDWNFVYEKRLAEAYLLVDGDISREILQEGPPTGNSEDYRKFIDKHTASGHELVYKDSRAYALVPRKFMDPKAFIEDISKKDFISRRVKNIVVR